MSAHLSGFSKSNVLQSEDNYRLVEQLVGRVLRSCHDQGREVAMQIVVALHPEDGRLTADEIFFKRLKSDAEKVMRGMAELSAHGIDLLIAENVLTIPMHVPLGVAITEFLAETRLPAIAHHHDFYWERTRFLVNSVGDYLRMAFPPNLPSIEHVVINSTTAPIIYSKGGSILRQLEAWIGATYQNVRETQRGTFPVPELGLAVYDIELEQSPTQRLRMARSDKGAGAARWRFPAGRRSSRTTA